MIFRKVPFMRDEIKHFVKNKPELSLLSLTLHRKEKTMTTTELTSDRLTELRDRVRLGNDRTMAAWREAVDGNLSLEQWSKATKVIEDAIRRLDSLCLELIVIGGDTCLYNTPRCKGRSDVGCFCCPSKIPYWRHSPEQGEML